MTSEREIFLIRAYLGVGSNLGDRLQNLNSARVRVTGLEGVRFLRASSVYESDPVGGPPQGKYLNAVWEIETDLTAETLLGHLQTIERDLGRERLVPNGARTLDLDLLFYGDQIFETGFLTVPHPRLHERFFTLVPLMELSPDLRHPKQGKTIRRLFEEHRENLSKSV